MSDDGASAITVIAFVGSVFSPYYALARRRGDADPEHHVAINVAVYDRNGGFAMTERGRASLSRGPDRFVVGPSRLEAAGDRLDIHVDERAAPIPRRLAGRIRVTMPRLHHTDYRLDPVGGHVWRPIAPVARIAVELDGPPRAWTGHGYVDHNHGDEPLEDGFARWTWARISDAAGTAIVYSTVPRRAPPLAFLLTVGADGTTAVRAAPPRGDLGRTLWRIERPVHAEDAGATRLLRTLEDTPFYARSAVRLALAGRIADGVHESLDLDRFRRPIVQAMLPFRMPRRAGG